MNDRPDEENSHFHAAYSLKTNAQTRQHYKSWAETYDHEVNELNGYAQPQRVADMIARVQPDLSSKILDAGCGSGLSGLAICQSGYTNIDGCDFSPEMLEKSLEKGCYSRLFEANLNEALPDISDSSYDIVTCVGVFSFGHVFPDACDELLRVLRAGGHLIIALNEQYWDKGDLADKLAILEGAGVIEILEKQFGEHMPGHQVNGWVITAVKK